LLDSQPITYFRSDKKFPHLSGSGVVDRIDRNEPQTVRLVEEAVVETRPTPKFRPDNDAVAVTERRPPERFTRAKYPNNRNVEGGRKMHGAAVVANRELATT
jgi:hypothetical protein